MKKIISIILICILLLGNIVSVAATDSLVSDTAGVLTSDEVYRLDETATEIYDEIGIAVFIRIVEDLGGVTPESYAENLHFSTQDLYPDSIVFVIAMESRQWTVQTFNEGHTRLADEDIDYIMGEVLPLLSEGRYNPALMTFLTHVRQICAVEADPTVNFIIALVIGLVVALIVLLLMRRGMNTARAQSSANNYMDKSTYNLYHSRDFYLYSHTTRVRRESNNSASHGGSRGGRSGRF